jgi:hypothetical protein
MDCFYYLDSTMTLAEIINPGRAENIRKPGREWKVIKPYKVQKLGILTGYGKLGNHVD